MNETSHRSGFVAVVGKPNVGKSTLVNALIGHKISIVTSKPHTTRHAILGVLTEADSQMVFIDTPGLENRQRKLMNRAMNRAAAGAIEGADIAVFVTDGTRWEQGDDQALEMIRATNIPAVLVVNKIDKVRPKEKLLPMLSQLAERHDFVAVVPVSALKTENVATLKTELLGMLPEEQAMYPAEMLTDRGERFQAAEVIREKLMATLRQEVPYGLGVEINEMAEDEKGLLRIDAIIWIDRESHKGIVIGRGGEVLKKIGQEARQELQERFGRALHLETRVRVKKNWSDNQQALQQMGFDSGI